MTAAGLAITGITLTMCVAGHTATATPDLFMTQIAQTVFAEVTQTAESGIMTLEATLSVLPTPTNTTMPTATSHDIGPTRVNEQDLMTEDGPVTGTSGQDLYNWYLLLEDDPSGWWWEEFGEDGDFSIGDILAVIVYAEAQHNWQNPYLAEASIRDANTWCIAMTGQSCTVEGYINHAAWEYESGAQRVGPMILPEKDADPKAGGWLALQGFSALYENHPAEWDEGCIWDRPCGWGNLSMFGEAGRNIFEDQLTVFAYEGSGNSWIIPSLCVIVRWQGGGAPNLVDLDASCPQVRSSEP